MKDLFDTAGVRTTYGSKVFAEHVPDRTAAAVARLEAAGWEWSGKANLHEFAYGITSQNPHYGTVPNPSFPGRTAGGSSGGSAAAVASGEADVGLGTDTGGSLRIPAACCALTGFKPTFGTVPMDGCFPLAPSFDHAGPIARDVAGCAEAMRALAGIHPPIPPALDEVRFGCAWLEWASPPVRSVLERAATLPTSVLSLELPTAVDVFPAFQAEIAEVHAELFSAHRDAYGSNLATKIEACNAVTGDERERAERARSRLCEALEGALERCDVLLAPTLPCVPPPAARDELEVRAEMTLLTFPANAAGLPALALPCGLTDDGLPVSLQLIGARGADGAVLAVAASVEEALRNTADRNPANPSR